ncbi:MAG: VWA domain-containing protein [Deltaproteobacteria bacterium]|nr:VWA domain-containing protein [Deltaproteobacteria bacterium]
MEEKEIKKLISELKVPEPGKEARDRAVRSAISEFRKQKEKKFKGFSWIGRLTGKKYKGGIFMTRPITIAAGITVGCLVLMISLSGIFSSHNFKFHKSSEIKPVLISQRKEALTSEAGRGQNIINKKGDAKTSADQVTLSVSPNKPVAVAKVKSNEIHVSDSLFVGSNSFPASSTRQGLEIGRAPVSPEYIGRDNFEKIITNPINLVAEKPVSTFSIDVDTTSYSFVRRALNEGYLPQDNAVRVEEMINYFDYDYPVPKDKTEPFKPTVAVFPTPWDTNTKLLHIGIKGFDIPSDAKTRSNLVFLIDVSGSMESADKLPLLKNSLRMLVDTLEPEDTVSMVVYAGAAGVVLDKTKIREKGEILDAIDRLEAGGSTAGGAGIELAYSIAEANMQPGALNRVILATDGDFNVGISDPEVLKNFVERKRDKNIFLTVLGFGQGNYNDALMQKLAQNGNGNAAYIDNLNEARKVLVEQAKGTLFTIAKDVKIQVEFNPARVAEYRLIGYESRMLNREDFNNDKVDAGDIGSGHTVTALYEITPTGSKGRLIDDLRYGEDESNIDKSKKERSEYAFLKIRYKLPDETTSNLITKPIGPESEYNSLAKSPEDSRFAAAVAAFGQLLRGGAHMGKYSYDDVINLARDARGEDAFGYRAEFLNLVRLAKTARAMGDR